MQHCGDHLLDAYPLLLSETHDIHGLHGLIIHLIVLLSWKLDMSSHQEPVVAEALQQQLLTQFPFGSSHHVIEDVEGPLSFSLSDTAGLL
uniref:Uncharacterized protein n=1 Tax=Anguilla anguilla TaxID=7936 RepID=A0A0E9TF59_ANGAN